MTWIPSNFTGGCIDQPPLRNCEPGSFLAFMSFIVQYLGSSYDNLYSAPMPSNQQDNNEYDFIIVGAGSAGCVIANRLSEMKNWKVLLLEAGDEEPVIADVPGLATPFVTQSSIDYGYFTNPEPSGNFIGRKTRFRYPRGKVMGGTSSINGMIYNRGNKWDYDNWHRLGNEGWSWNDVLPYFVKSEGARDPWVLSKSPESHGTDGYLKVGRFPAKDPNAPAILEAWKELGLEEIDYNNGSQIGAGRMQFTTVHGSRLSSNGAFIRPIRSRRSNLVIKSNCKVKKILIDRETNRAYGVKYENGNNRTFGHAYATKEVIISAGAIDSPKLLLLSGVGPAEDLRKLNIDVIRDLPVGRNLQDHFYVTPLIFNLTKSIPFPGGENLQNDVVEWLNTHEGPLSGLGMSDTFAYYRSSFEAQPDVPDIQYFFYGHLSRRANASATFGSQVPMSYYDTAVLGATMVAPKSRGYVKLNSTDPYGGQPEIQFNFLDHPQDKKVMVEGVRFAMKFASTEALKNRGFKSALTFGNRNCEDFGELGGDDYYECVVENAVQPGYHTVGSCKMGPIGDRTAVVGPDLKVHGLEGLRVIDASVMPVVPRGNTNAPTVMIAEKGSDLIKKDWL